MRDAPLANAPLVALQDGDGGWSVLTGSGGTYAAPVTHERYAVACATATGSSVEVFFAATSDHRTIEARACPRATAPAALDIELLRIVNDDGGRVWVGGDSAEAARGSVTKALPPVPQQLAVSGVELTDEVRVVSAVDARFADLSLPLRTAVFGAGDVTTYAALDERIRQPTDLTSVTVSAARTRAGWTYTRAVRFDHLQPVAEAVILPAELEAAAPTLSNQKQERLPSDGLRVTIRSVSGRLE